MSDVVRAAGGVPVRVADGVVEVLLVHRPRYGDWTFPKGKCEEGESDETCAIREVEEEAGLRCVLEEELPATEYLDDKGRPKRVRAGSRVLPARRDVCDRVDVRQPHPHTGAS